MRNILIAVGAVIALVILFFVWQLFLRPHLPFLGPTEKVTIGQHTFQVEVAKTDKDRQKGLSGRGSLKEGNGMLFVFDKPDYYSFWMKDMKFPLDILYINGDKIVTIYKNVPPPSSPDEAPQVLQPTTPADKVLEISGGLTDTYSIKEGDSVTTSL